MSEGSFARNHLEKYGWEEGKGLGRTETGMTDALKPKLKFDKAGIGHDVGEQFSFHWWDHVFNKAAKNIHIENTEEGVKVKQKGTKKNLISNKRSTHEKKDKKKPLIYGSFVKHGTLTDGAISQDKEASSSSSSSDESDDDKPLATYEGNDEMLFKACGGRTAHKGARHGLLLSGKLQRLEEQDNLHNNMMKMERKGTKEAPTVDEMERDESGLMMENKKRKEHKRRTKEDNKSEELMNSSESQVTDRLDVREEEDGEDDALGRKQRKKKKKSNFKEETSNSGTIEDTHINGINEEGSSKDSSSFEVELKQDDDSISATKSRKKKSKKGKKTKERTNVEMMEEDLETVERNEMQHGGAHADGPSRKKKSKKEKRRVEMEGEIENDVELGDGKGQSSPRGQKDIKRKRRKDRSGDSDNDNAKEKEVGSDEEVKPKKKKKKDRRMDRKRQMQEEDED
ncbi:G patch domain-containing protein 4 [Strongylocentrotus purpuratus]|uniref:G patch domain-containing protein 4 n=1 Tax=Strongylocentrotus purpuratus TaxID=7668 RepID=A0A7M7RFE1_STRPU|nr:G patch domain-containing protein 4 [Strongylocentrotus purpuratus]|eukprot:XP_786634.2 PREDICTED: G patch domain-containing protein 4 [Strongylocentrotus purpuratus]